MSYAFHMAFLPAGSLFEAYAKADGMAKALLDEKAAAALLKKTLPHFLDRAGLLSGLRIRGAAAHHLEDWLYPAFTIRCTFWPEHSLLGVSGRGDPSLLPADAGKPVLFQDSTDQDYPYDDWPELPFFQERIARAMLADCSEIARMFQEGPDSDKELPYYRRVYCYRTIAEDLHVKDWLYERPTNVFRRFSMCGISSGGNLAALVRLARTAAVSIPEN